MKTTKPVWFTPRESVLLQDIIDMNIEGIHAAKEVTTVDPTVQTADELNDLMSGYEDDLVTCSNIREKVTKCQTLNVSPRTITLLLASIYTVRRLIAACSGRPKR